MNDRSEMVQPLVSARYQAFTLAHADQRLFKLLLAGLIAVWAAAFAFLACSEQMRTTGRMAPDGETLVRCEAPRPAAPGVLLRCIKTPPASEVLPSI